MVAFVLGGVAAVTAERLTRDLGTNPSSETIARVEATISDPAGSPVAVEARVVRLPDGFEQRRTPDGTTLNLVQSGRVEIENEEGTSTYFAGMSFLAPAGEPYVIRVERTAVISVLDLLPGAP